MIFVVGCGRSGTTVLRTALDAHPELAISWEAGFVYPLSRKRARWERPGGFATAAFMNDLLALRAVRQNLGYDEALLREALAGPPVVDYADATRRVFAGYAARAGKERYGDKKPSYVLHIDALAALFPESVFVHIVRDGRDVALSTLALQGNTQDVVDVAFSWRSRVGAGRRAGQRLGPERYLEVRYEALVEEPAVELDRVCDFLGIGFVDEMLDVATRRDGTPPKVLSNPRHARLSEPLSPGRRSWRTAMADSDIAAFEAVGGSLLDELGYELGATSIPLNARARAGRGWVRLQVNRTRARLPGIVRRTVGTPGVSPRSP